MKLGWVGLGSMGAPMVLRAHERGHVVQAFDVLEAGRARVSAEGVTIVVSPADAARGVEVLVIMVATADQVEQVLFGAEGAATTLEPDSCVMVMATVGDGVVPGWHERLALLGVHLLDAPVSGGAVRAREGNLLIMVSGSDAAVARVGPLLTDLAAHAPVVGLHPGAGQRIKLVNQLLCGVHITAAAEALAFAESIGLDAGKVWEVIRHGAAGSFMLEDRGTRMLEADPTVASRVDIFVKDMGLVVAAADQAGQPTDLARSAQAVFQEASARGWGGLDDSRALEVYRSRRA